MKMETAMATMKEIAALSGVSRGTVDRVLNHRGSVSPDTAAKVLEIAEKLNYQHNKAGLMLATEKKYKNWSDPLSGHKSLFSGSAKRSLCQGRRTVRL